MKWITKLFRRACRHSGGKTRHVEWEDYETDNGMKGSTVKDYWWTCNQCGAKVQP
jgi:hypothetical protein